MSEKNNTLKITIVVLCTIIFVLSGYILYDKVLNNTGKNEDNKVTDNIPSDNELDNNNDNNNTNLDNDTTNEENKTQSYTSLNGTYEIVKDTWKGERAEGDLVYETFYFNDNGLFKYESNTLAAWGYYGYYTIQDNKIKLNYLFSLGSGWPSLSGVSNKESILVTIIDEENIQLDDGSTFRKNSDYKDIKKEIDENLQELMSS